MTYEYRKRKFGAFEKITIKHPKIKNGFTIVPGCGLNLLELFFNKKNVLEGYETPEALKEGKWSKNILLFPFPNRLLDGKYFWNGKYYQFPINNVATNNAIHGMIQQAPFEVTRIELQELAAEVTCRYEYDGMNAAYPFPFTIFVTFGISSSNRFRLAFDVLNRHSLPIPVGFGWHPYFKLTENTEEMALSLPEAERVDIDQRMIPKKLLPFNAWRRSTRLGDAFLDTCFKATAKGRYRMSLKGDKDKLTLVADTSTFPYFQVFTPPHKKSVALEPMTCNIDAFNNHEGLEIIQPGGIWKGAFFLEYSK